MVYLDNAATSYPKPEKVYEEIDRCMREYCANPGRGGHAMSIVSGKEVMKCRERICSFFNIKNPLRVCFTKNATEAINIAFSGFLKSGDHVITTSMEHNSVIRPLRTLQRDRGIQLTIVHGNSYGEVAPEDILKSIQPHTQLIVCTLSSNVNGTILPIKEIGDIASRQGIEFFVDASQGAGTLKVDVLDQRIGLMAFPGHKGLLGPQGTGGLYVRPDLVLKPMIQGGTGSNSEMLYQPEMMPDLLESGTLNTPGIVGLSYGIEFIESIGSDNLKVFKHKMTQKIHEGLMELSGVSLYSRMDIDKNSGIIAFRILERDCVEVSNLLDQEYGIATRAGLHCAPMAHETLGTASTGLVRVSPSYFNTMDEIDYFLEAMKKICNQ